MTTEKIEPDWLSRVKEVHKFHINKLKENPKWRIEDTAKELQQSKGLTSEQLKVASWLRSHSAHLEQFEYFKDAIEFIRARAHKFKTEDIDLG